MVIEPVSKLERNMLLGFGFSEMGSDTRSPADKSEAALSPQAVIFPNSSKIKLTFPHPNNTVYKNSINEVLICQ
jgi:hypothetical protein